MARTRYGHSQSPPLRGLPGSALRAVFAEGYSAKDLRHDVLAGLVVGVIWGGALLASLVPHYGVSWQAHLCGAIGGVIAAWILAQRPGPAPAPTPAQPPPPPPPAPAPTAAAAKASVGQGDTGAVVALSVPQDPATNPRPDVDVTVGRRPLVGDAPPSDGTGLDVSLAPTTPLFSLNGLPSR